MPTPPEYNKNPEPMKPPQPANSAAPFGVSSEEVSSEGQHLIAAVLKYLNREVLMIFADLNPIQMKFEITSRSSSRRGLNHSRGKRSINLNLN